MPQKSGQALRKQQSSCGKEKNNNHNKNTCLRGTERKTVATSAEMMDGNHENFPYHPLV